MNVLLLMGRGIEGTGNTRITIELEEYLKNNGIETKILANCEKKWPRRLSQQNDIIEKNFLKDNLDEYIIDDMILIISSVPSKKDSFESKTKFMNFIQLAKSHNAKLVYWNCDNRIHSTNRNFYATEEYRNDFFKLLDLVCLHTFKNDFYQKFIKKYNLDEITNYIEFPLVSIDMSELSQYIVPYELKYNKTCHFIGRNTMWKGWTVLRDFQHDILKHHDYSTTIEGIELSIGYLNEIFKNVNINRDIRDDIYLYSNEINDDYMHHGADVSVYGPYNRIDALKRVAKSQFGAFFTYLGENFNGPIEITFLEIVAVGTIPIIRKELWETAQFMHNSKFNKYRDYLPKDLGIIIYDSDNPTECVSLMNDISSNKELYNTYITNAQKFVSQIYDRNIILKNLWLNILHHINL